MRPRPYWLLAVATMLAACDGVTTYGPVQSKSPIPEQHIYIAAAKGSIVAEVRGNPFSGAVPGLADWVRGYMENGTLGPPVRFVAAQGPATVEPYRVVVLFNAAPGAHYRGLCTGTEQQAGQGAGGYMTVSMGFCFGSDQISATWGSVRGVTGPDDPKFRALIQQTAITLVPMHRETRESE